MPTIDRGEGYRVVIRTREPARHPPHVHVMLSGGQAAASVALGDEEDGPYLLAFSTKMKPRDRRRALELVRKKRAAYRKKWEEYHAPKEGKRK